MDPACVMQWRDCRNLGSKQRMMIINQGCYLNNNLFEILVSRVLSSHINFGVTFVDR